MSMAYLSGTATYLHSVMQHKPKMKRQDAINELVNRKLSQLTSEERKEQLEIMTLEGWSDAPSWSKLPKHIQQEFEDGELSQDPKSKVYDDVLRIWLSTELQGVSNNFLAGELGVSKIFGNPAKLEACPCCGSRTLGERAAYEICRVCWWEDDGQDNNQADIIMGGPNKNISLTLGRYNFIKFGLFNPNRKDLMKLREPKEKYEEGRIFELEGNNIIESKSNWKGSL